MDKAERVARYVRVEASEEGWQGGVRVQSPILPQSELQVQLLSSSFARSCTGALSFPTLQWIAVLVVETLVFGVTR